MVMFKQLVAKKQRFTHTRGYQNTTALSISNPLQCHPDCNVASEGLDSGMSHPILPGHIFSIIIRNLIMHPVDLQLLISLINFIKF